MNEIIYRFIKKVHKECFDILLMHTVRFVTVSLTHVRQKHG